MQINGATALVTGANRGLGRRFAQALLDRGAAKVYAAARDPRTVDLPGVVPVRLDITDPAQVAAAAELAPDVDLLINNAGTGTGATLLDEDPANIRLEMETHYFGTLSVARAFAPVLAAAGGGALVNVLSVLSWTTAPGLEAYSAAKAAELSLTNGLRLALADQKTLVTALHVGFMDTELVAHVDAPKSDPLVVANLALDGVEAGEPEVVADERSRQVRAALSGPLSLLFPSVA
ncbi:SDR family oxidoreductase [Actinophytocola sp.]|uniref:SDR family oxidoreductase n=1 Tax=Actinophytocola sp. TaxID=1872138 RepID=UPI00389B232D